MQESIPIVSRATLVLDGEGHARQHGGDTHAVAALSSMYMLAGQRTVRETLDTGDSRPSVNITLTFHTEKGGPS